MVDPRLNEIRELLPSVVKADLPRLRARLHGLHRAMKTGRMRGRAVESLTEAVLRSARTREARAAWRPTIAYPSELPVSQRADELRALIEQHQVLVVCGETGSGKSTQLPKLCLELGRGVDGTIAHTQPRRIAATSIASRLAEETLLPLGKAIGSKVRFSDNAPPEALVKVLTDGMLLAETQGDRFLSAYDTIIIDEAHERSLNIDFLLGLLKQLLPQRPDLKVIVTSATIDPQRFSEHFDNCPIVEVSGRTYPVEMRHHEPALDDRTGEPDYAKAIVEGVQELGQSLGPTGDILVFLPGEREIREAADALRKYAVRERLSDEVLPLYARLSAAEQQRAFRPAKHRRIVLATNVAETSITVPGIRGVIDTGIARISRYSARNRLQRLQIEPISRASADQRAGRCGRIGPGVCIRLYSREDFERRSRFTDPEILRSNLAGVILQMRALGLGRIDRFPFVEAPDARMIREGERTLHELGALDEAGELTGIGRDLARLPVDPRIGRMVLAATELGCLGEVLIIASALAVQDPRERPAERAELADEAHKSFESPESDFLTSLRLWELFHAEGERLSQSRLRKWCHDRFVNYQRLREWQDVHRQLRELMAEQGHRAKEPAENADSIHKALLTGLLGSIGRKGEGYEYLGPHGLRFHLFPGSTLFSQKPEWVMAAEIVRTTRVYARTVAPIQPEWVEKAALHLVTRTYQEPFWEARRGRVNAWEKISLYGLEVIPRRKVHYGPIAPAECRDMFIAKALVDGDYPTSAPFARHNKRLIKEVERIEARLRTRDLLASPQERHAFFDARLPADVFSGERFEQWRRNAEKREPTLLFMEQSDVMREAPGEDAFERFPERLELDGATVPVRYRFDPGKESDGVTITLPVEAVASFDESRADWLIPGLVREKAVAMIRGLPKGYRRLFGPAKEFVDQAFAGEVDRSLPLADLLSRRLVTTSGNAVPPSAWREVSLPEHLRLRYRVIDAEGQELATGRELTTLRERVADRLGPEAGAIGVREFTADGLHDWTVGTLPESIQIERRGIEITAYPALLDRGDSVAMRAMDTREQAERSHRAGVRRLYEIVAHDDIARAIKGRPGFDRAAVLHAPLGPADALRRGLSRHIADAAYVAGRPLPRDEESFRERIEPAWNDLGDAAPRVLDAVVRTLERAQMVSLSLDRRLPNAFAASLADMGAQLGAIVGPGFLEQVPPDRLAHLPRYLAGIQSRLEKLGSGGLDRDRRAMETLSPYLRALGEAASRSDTPEWERLRWLTEELRVSLFAQELRTAESVAARKLDALVEALRARGGGEGV